MLMLSACSKNDEKQAGQTEESIKQEYLQNGSEIAQLTQAELMKNVSRAMQKGGPVYAIEYCNVHALSIKDSLSRTHDCEIQRIALKYRNPMDEPQTELAREQLIRYKQAHEKGENLQPEVYLFDERVEYYKPIFVAMETCLRCHGQPGTDIAEATLAELEERYPDDLATGYELNDFRGAWKITFKR
jgi:hypothetical protein